MNIVGYNTEVGDNLNATSGHRALTVLGIVFRHLLSDHLTKIRPGITHGKQDSRHLQFQIHAMPDLLHHLQKALQSLSIAFPGFKLNISYPAVSGT